MVEETFLKCKIADLVVDVTTAGDMYSRCENYIVDNSEDAIFQVRLKEKLLEQWPLCDRNTAICMGTATTFYSRLIEYSGIVLHASAIEKDNRAYLFSANSGVGKSTHTRLWKQIYTDQVVVFNDDKPALRKVDGVWYAYGTPWCGKDGINENMKVPLAGICFLKQGSENAIRKLNRQEAIAKMLPQTIRRFQKVENLDKVLSLVDQLVREIPIYELVNKPEPEAAILSYETMRKGAEEAGL